MRKAFHIRERCCLVADERDGQYFVGIVDLDETPPIHHAESMCLSTFFVIGGALVGGFFLGALLAWGLR